ncbi:MAG: magnesium/cobalt transporter CorA [Erysipelotrichaceae bacterium]|nr:magnesium/cobalt transporter CorA [Erysipelotrichaceae bacterium]MDP3304791.1 magnesium/cobalt transporter CorA [Erysipelotrichaceae bacterium]
MKRTKLNQPPESVVYTGDFNNDNTIIEVFSYNQKSIKFETYGDADFESEIMEMMDTSNTIWINIIGLNVVETIIKLGEIFGLSLLVLEDIVHVSQRSKVEFTDNYLFSIFKMIYRADPKVGKPDKDSDEVLHEHLSILLLKNIVITFQENAGDVFDDVRRRLKENVGKIRTHSADYLYYVLLDALVDNQLEILASIGDEVDEHEQLTVEASKGYMNRLFKLRKQLLLIRASVIPFKDIMVELQSEESDWISSEVKVYLSDVSDHVNHVNDLVGLYREMVNNIYEINMLITGNKLNHIMAVLTVFTALFIPLNFMTGFYGMNFTHFPGMKDPNAIPIFLSISFIIVISMIVFFKKKKWF